MPLRILDTDTLSLVQRRNPTVTQRLQEFPAYQTAITVISVEEQMRGWLAQIKRTNDLEKLRGVYERFRSVVRAFSEITVLPFDEDSVRQLRGLQRLRLRVGTADLRIAAITLAHDGILITANTRDFEQIPGLKLEDWTIFR